LLIQFDQDPELNVAVLCGKGGTFCAGANLKVIVDGTSEERLAITPVNTALTGDVNYDVSGPMGYSRLLLSKPVIACVEGFAVAGGLELALWCDLRVVEEGAVMGVFCRRWGVPLIDGGTVRLTRLIGLSRAMDIILTGRPVKGKEAYEIGLANRLVPNGSALSHSIQLAKEIASFPQITMKADRMSAIKSFDEPSLQHALAGEFKRGVLCLGQAQEGSKNFVVNKEGRHGSYDEFKSKL
jgi:enoyl-CoA hydratase